MNIKSFITLIFLLFSISLCAQQKGAPQDLEVQQFASAIQKAPGTILDVRTPDEVARGIIEGALVIDFYDEDFKKQLKKLDRTKPVYVYCASGGRSADAAEMLTEMGYKQVFNLAGGIKAWKAAGKPVVVP
jgi:rhodanese-related sulfurtransferase